MQVSCWAGRLQRNPLPTQPQTCWMSWQAQPAHLLGASRTPMGIQALLEHRRLLTCLEASRLEVSLAKQPLASG